MGTSMVAMANGKSDCSAASGSYVTGKVVSGPTFKGASSSLQGIGLTHTHVGIVSDQDGKTYDVAMDNVYAADYKKNAKTMPASLAAIKKGDHLELCGQLYTSGGPGIHWVHDNCNVTPTSSTPNGFTKEVSSKGVEGSNLEASQAYCYLWN
jgi:hypothetical protein